ncbi:AraC family transcriptional regulator N-terminal domain-containing protein [Radicibacter daui]|uniref:AraC family transcriptional regulator N-terminal domain-containing protein n=1 Tax=Radicibacter daui TaxID=3064829 RepID=UPI004046E6FC
MRGELAGIISRYLLDDGMVSTPVPGLHFFRQSVAQHSVHAIYRPAFALVVQGSKRAVLGDQTFEYDHRHGLLVSVDLPMISHIFVAGADQPYLCLVIEIDPTVLRTLLAQSPLPAAPPAPPAAAVRGISVAPLEPVLMDAVLRLCRLLDNQQDIAALAPLVQQEILYRLLAGPQGHWLRDVALSQGHAPRITEAVAWLQRHYARPLRVEELAQQVGMSLSSLHHHFKAATALSPLQYQKQLRLREARRLMLVGEADAATASLLVGYESPSQFSREYSRLYGAPPARDIARLRSAGQPAVF